MALYSPTFLSPENSSISASVGNAFTCQVNASGQAAVNYRLIIYTMASVSVYDTGTVALSPYKYDKETLSHTVPSSTLTNGVQYKWKITTNPAAATPTWSKETPFWAYAVPTVVFSATPATMTSKKNTFTCVYTQAQSVPFKQWKMIWYDSLNEIIEDTGWLFSGNISHEFDGFVNGNSYKVICYVEDQYGTASNTGLYSFSASYSAPNVNIGATIEAIDSSSAIHTTWAKAVQVTGVVTGTSSYEGSFVVPGNFALSMSSGSSVNFVVSIPLHFSMIFFWRGLSGFTGDICKLGDSTIISYDGTRFIMDINGYKIYSENVAVNSTTVFKFGVRPTDFYVAVYWISGGGVVWEDDLAWDDVEDWLG